MESSSENSFTWTDTSNDSIDSNTMAQEVEDKTEFKTTESAKKSVKKKKKVLCNSYNGVEEEQVEELTAKSKNKIHSEGKHKKLIKQESESDVDTDKAKKKHKYSDVKSTKVELPDSSSYDESFLDLKVKQEEVSNSSTSKIKGNLGLISNNSLDEYETKYTDNNSSVMAVEVTKSKKKKKKSKKRHDSESQDEDKQREKSQDTSTFSETKEMSMTDNNMSQDESGYEEISAIQCESDDSHTISFSDGRKTKALKTKNESLHKNAVLNQFKMVNNGVISDLHTVPASEKATPSMSDRIRFEDDSDTDVRQERISSKLKRFMKTNSNMSQISNKMQKSSIITQNDEIWIVKCPSDIDIQSFCNTDLNIQSKCKLKLSGQTYEGSLAECNTTTASSMLHDKFRIENFHIQGIINFRKRIPKAHFRDDNVMINNQTNFIPLPETKCRHPLFGSNYKKSLKIPAAIVERLNGQHNGQEAIPTGKRKKKKHKLEKMDVEEADVSNTNLEPTTQKTEKKKKKRKYSDVEDGPTPKKVKRIKHDPESAEAWESERAIEKNLFDF